MGRRPADERNADTILPFHLRGASEQEVDEYIEQRLAEFDMTAEYSETSCDPLRLLIARELLRLALDPRIADRDIRARSVALTGATKALGLDRDSPRKDADRHSVEVALKRLKEAASRGIEATGRVPSERTRQALSKVPVRPTVLLCQSSSGSQRTIEAGVVRDVVPSPEEDPRQD